MSMSLRALLAIMTAHLAACEVKDDGDSLSVDPAACAWLCFLPGCDGVTTIDPNTPCPDRCVAKEQETHQHGAECTEAYVDAIECFAALDCEEYLAWEASGDPICGDALASFEARCPGVAFEL